MKKFFVLALVLFSCSQFQNKSLEPVTLEHYNNSLQKICRQGSGRGRFIVGEKRWTFDFDSTYSHKNNKGKWLVNIEVPMAEDETLAINRTGNKFYASGSLLPHVSAAYRKLQSENPQLKKGQLEQFFSMTGKMLFSSENFSKLKKEQLEYYFSQCPNDRELRCLVQYKAFDQVFTSQSSSFLYTKNKSYRFEWTNRNLKDYFVEQVFSLEQRVDDSSQPLFSLELHYKTCKF